MAHIREHITLVREKGILGIGGHPEPLAANWHSKGQMFTNENIGAIGNGAIFEVSPSVGNGGIVTHSDCDG